MNAWKTFEYEYIYINSTAAVVATLKITSFARFLEAKLRNNVTDKRNKDEEKKSSSIETEATTFTVAAAAQDEKGCDCVYTSELCFVFTKSGIFIYISIFLTEFFGSHFKLYGHCVCVYCV